MMPDSPYRLLGPSVPPAYPLREPPWRLLMMRLQDEADQDWCAVNDFAASFRITPKRVWGVVRAYRHRLNGTVH